MLVAMLVVAHDAKANAPGTRSAVHGLAVHTASPGVRWRRRAGKRAYRAGGRATALVHGLRQPDRRDPDDSGRAWPRPGSRDSAGRRTGGIMRTKARFVSLAVAILAAVAAWPGAADAARNDTTLVSISGVFGPKSDGPSFTESVSADGRFIAFASSATNFDPADPDGTEDVYVRDLEENTTTLVSRASGPAAAKANHATSRTAISADGRFVEFATGATNLPPED